MLLTCHGALHGLRAQVLYYR